MYCSFYILSSSLCSNALRFSSSLQFPCSPLLLFSCFRVLKLSCSLLLFTRYPALLYSCSPVLFFSSSHVILFFSSRVLFSYLPNILLSYTHGLLFSSSPLLIFSTPPLFVFSCFSALVFFSLVFLISCSPVLLFSYSPVLLFSCSLALDPDLLLSCSPIPCSFDFLFSNSSVFRIILFSCFPACPVCPVSVFFLFPWNFALGFYKSRYCWFEDLFINIWSAPFYICILINIDINTHKTYGDIYYIYIYIIINRFRTHSIGYSICKLLEEDNKQGGFLSWFRHKKHDPY